MERHAGGLGQDVSGGTRYSLMATTIAVEESDCTADEPTRIKVEVDTYDRLSVIDDELRVTRSAPQVLVGNMRLTWVRRTSSPTVCARFWPL